MADKLGVRAMRQQAVRFTLDVAGADVSAR
jgi:hypothetical protein